MRAALPGGMLAGGMVLSVAALAIGVLLGIFSGLMPGIHSNTVASLLAAMPVQADALSRIDVRVLNLGVLAYLACAVFLVSGAGGLLILATATAVGLLPPLLGIRRTHVMGLIIVPSIALSL